MTRRKALVTGEVYVPDTGSVSPFSIFLSSGRSGFAWVLLQSEDRWTLALFGGIIGAGQDGVPLADVELLEIPR